MPSYTTMNSFPQLAEITVTTSWEEITLPNACSQVDVYAVTNSIVFDYAASPAIEAPIEAGLWFTVYAKMGKISSTDKTFQLKGTTDTTVFLRFL